VEIESDFLQPELRVDRAQLESAFEDASVPSRRDIMRNYHRESPVSEARRAKATPAAVLIPIVDHGDELRLLLTRRHHEISYPEHLCFPGGRRDPEDASAEANALREAHEEIGLLAENVRVLGRLADYYTQSGFCIKPIVSLVTPPLSLSLAPYEVTEVVEIPLDVATRSDSYRLWQPEPDQPRAFYSLIFSEEIVVTGPTVCLLMGFYEALARVVRA